MKSIAKIWWIALFIKIIIGTFMPLSFDETYYWFWSHNLQLSYFDHPPGVAWLFWLGQPFEGFFHFVRMPAVLLSHITLLIWLYILKPYLTETQLKIWLVLALLSPLMGFGGLIVTPDIPLMFFWSVATYYLLKVQKNPSLQNYVLLGSVLGLTFTAKYHAALFLPMALIWLFHVGSLNKNSIKKILIGFLFFMVFAAPVFLWNYQNDFISFKFQLTHGLGDRPWKFSWLTNYIIGQLLLFSPFFIYKSIRGKSQLPYQAKSLFVIFGWLPLLFFLYSSLKGPVEANWTIIAFPYILSLAVATPINQFFNKTTMAFWGAVSVIILSFVFIKPLRKTTHFNKVEQMYLIPDLIPKIKAVINNKPLFGRDLQTSSQLAYHLKKPVYKLKGINRFDFNDMRTESIPTQDYFIFLKKEERLPEWTASTHKIINKHPLSDEYVLAEVSVQ